MSSWHCLLVTRGNQLHCAIQGVSTAFVGFCCNGLVKGWWRDGSRVCGFVLLVLVAANSLLSCFCVASLTGFKCQVALVTQAGMFLLSLTYSQLLSLCCNPTPPLLQHQLGLGGYREVRGGRFACLRFCLAPSNGGYQPLAAIQCCAVSLSMSPGLASMDTSHSGPNVVTALLTLQSAV